MSLKPSERKTIDSLNSKFSSALQSGKRPNLEPYLQKCKRAAVRDELLKRLLTSEVEFYTRSNASDWKDELYKRYAELPDQTINELIEKVATQADAKSIQSDQTIIDGAFAPTINPASNDSNATQQDKTIVDTPDDKTMTGNDPPTLTLGEKTVAPTPETHSEPNASKQFGDYELEREIARGGMGVVYKARQVKLNRPCALKMILSGNLAGDEEVQRFYAEAESAANLSHTGIVPIFEVGQVDGQHFFSMGFIEGASLAQSVADGPLQPRQAAGYTREIADAIAHAHEHGLIHRDLKPANVLVDKDGQPKVTDFGLAKQIKGDSDLTATGQILGTPSYMPPEQASGESQNIDETSDIYSIGGILYFLMTGRPPFQASTPMDTLLQVMDSEPVSPMRLNPLVPKDLETICLKCLSKQKNRRFATANELVEELDRFLSDEPILSRPITRAERAWRWCKKRPMISGLTAVLAVVLIGILIAAPIVAIRESDLRQSADQQRKDAEESEARATQLAQVANDASEVAERQREEAEQDLYAATISLIHREWSDNNVRRARQLLAICPEQHRNWEFDYLDTLCNLESLVIPGQQISSQFVIDWPRRQILVKGVVVTTGQFTVRRYDLATGTEIGSIASGVLLSPDGRKFIRPQDNAINVHLCEDQSLERVILFGPTSHMRGGAFSHDGSLLALAQPDSHPEEQTDGKDLSHLYVFDVHTGRQVAHLDGLPDAAPFTGAGATPHGNMMPICFSKDRSKLVIAGPGSPSSIQVWDLESETMTHEFSGHIASITNVQFNHDGTLVASSGSDGFAKIWDLETNALLHTLSGHHGRVYDAEFSASGETIATGGWDNTLRIWSVATGQELSVLRGSQSPIVDVELSDDGTEIVGGSLDGSVRVWRSTGVATLSDSTPSYVLELYDDDNDNELSGNAREQLDSYYASHRLGQESRVVAHHSGVTQCVALSPDGLRMATAGHDEFVRVWDTLSGELMHEFDSYVYVHGMQFDPTGKYLAFPSGPIVQSAAGRQVPGYGWIEIRDVESGELHTKFETINTPISSVCFNSDGSRIAGACGLHAVYAPRIGVSDNLPGRVIVWDTETKEMVWETECHGNMSANVSFSADDQRIASTGMDGALNIWDAATGDHIHTINAAMANTCTFSRDGKYLAGACGDEVIRIWDANTYERIHRLEAHYGPIYMVTFSPDGKRLFSAGLDSTVRIWDSETGRMLMTLMGHASEVPTVAIDGKGRRLATADYTGFVRIWDRGESARDAESFDVVVYEDDFERETLGADWTTRTQESHVASIDDGQLRLTIATREHEGLGVTLPAASAGLGSLILPDEVEISFDAKFEEPNAIQVHFSDEYQWQGEHISAFGVDNPFTGAKSVDINVQTGYVSYIDVNKRSYEGLATNQVHHFVIRRMREGIRVMINGKEVVFADVRTRLRPLLGLSGSYGRVGSHVWIDNVKITTTQESMIRQESRAWLDELFGRWFVHEKVTDEIERDSEKADELKQSALTLLGEYRIDEDALTRELDRLATIDSGNDETNQLGLSYASALYEIDPSNPFRQLTRAYWLYRNDSKEEAGSLAENAEEEFQRLQQLHPGSVAIVALCKNPEESVLIRDLYYASIDRIRSARWQRDALASAIVDEARQELSETIEARDAKVEQLVADILDAEQALWSNRNDEPFRRLMLESCNFELLRADGTIDSAPDTNKYLLGMRGTNLDSGNQVVQFDKVTVDEVASDRQISFELVAHNSDVEMRVRQQYQCELIDDEWRIASAEGQMIYLRTEQHTMDYLTDFDTLEAAVEDAKQQEDDAQLVHNFSGAGRVQEAYQLAKERSERANATQWDWLTRSRYAVIAFELEDFITSLRTTADMFVGAPNQLRELRELLINAYIEFDRPDDLDSLLTSFESVTVDEWRDRLSLLRLAGKTMFDPNQMLNNRVASLWEKHLNDWLDAPSNSVELPDDAKDRFQRWMEYDANWWLIGPFPSEADYRGLDYAFPIELAQDRSAILELVDEHGYGFREVSSPPGEFIDLRSEVADQENAVAYAYCEVEVEVARIVTIRLGSDDGVRLFHNGTLVHSNRVRRAWREGRDQITLLLTEGTNRFLVKVDQAGGDWGFSLDFSDGDGWPIPVDWKKLPSNEEDDQN